VNECENFNTVFYFFLQAQFTFNVVYFLSGLIVPNCQYPTVTSIFFVVQNCIMLVMFYNFYRKAYRKQKHT